MMKQCAHIMYTLRVVHIILDCMPLNVYVNFPKERQKKEDTEL